MGVGNGSNLDLFRYLVADDADEYRAVMACFGTEPGLVLDAAELVAALAARGRHCSEGAVDGRCRRLVRWGNLTVADRDTRPGPVGDHGHAAARYRATVLGARVHREATAIAAAREGTREVTRESLRCIAEALAWLEDSAAAGFTDDPEVLAGHVTALFVHHRAFTDSVEDFVTHLAGSGTPTDDDHAAEGALPDHADAVATDVGRHGARIARRLERLRPHLGALLAALPDPGLPAAAATRAPGRTLADWAALAAWFDDDAGPRRLRDAAAAALHRLPARTRRMPAPDAGFSPRADLLRAAVRFSESSDEQAHRLFAAVFGAYPSRHLLLGPDEPDPRIGAGTSWWDAEPVPVPVSLRERGDRSPRGRHARVPAPTPAAATAEDLAARESRARADAVAELCTAGALPGAHLSPTARDLILDCVSTLLARYRTLDRAVRLDDHDLGLALTAEPGADTTVHCPDGNLTVHGLVLHAAPVDGTP